LARSQPKATTADFTNAIGNYVTSLAQPRHPQLGIFVCVIKRYKRDRWSVTLHDIQLITILGINGQLTYTDHPETSIKFFDPRMTSVTSFFATSATIRPHHSTCKPPLEVKLSQRSNGI
jgi:hypothetical protein